MARWPPKRGGAAARRLDVKLGWALGALALPWALGSAQDYNGSSIMCSGSQTLCKAGYSASLEGCCTMANAVCCSNGQTCCPEGTTCRMTGPYITDCVSRQNRTLQPGLPICKPGPQLAMDRSRKNVIVLGDSVSIGYTGVLVSSMRDLALVQHSPFDVMDGGVEETAYGLQCLDFFIRGPDGRLLEPDVLLFNWGLHNGAMSNISVPGENGNASAYLPELELITQRLSRAYEGTRTQLLFALTSPMLCNASEDAFVVARNKVVAKMMQRYNIPVLDPHAPIVERCGPAPQTSCMGIAGCWCPHCPGAGYVWLAQSVVEPALRRYLSSEPPRFRYV